MPPPLLLDKISPIHAKTWVALFGSICENYGNMPIQPPMKPGPRIIRIPGSASRTCFGLRIPAWGGLARMLALPSHPHSSPLKGDCSSTLKGSMIAGYSKLRYAGRIFVQPISG